jgi:hypothetical protein
MRECCVCGRIGNMRKHHVIHGQGKRKACETRESLVDICFDCHKLVHSGQHSDVDKGLKIHLQEVYYGKGYDEDKVRQLMGGKLMAETSPEYIVNVLTM